MHKRLAEFINKRDKKYKNTPGSLAVNTAKVDGFVYLTGVVWLHAMAAPLVYHKGAVKVRIG